MAAFDFMGSTDLQTGQFKVDPNFLKVLAQVGSGLGQGQGAGQALGGAASTLLENRPVQQYATPMLQNLQNMQVTPKGQAGPDSITTKQTAEGTTTTINEPSAAQLNTYGTTVPPEAMPKPGYAQQPALQGGSANVPFWAALLRNQQ